MVEPYDQHQGVIQAFRLWCLSSETRSTGIGGPKFETESSFIPLPELKSYFCEPQRLEHLLNAVLQNSNERSSVDADYVRDNCLQTFAILLVIGQGHSIPHFLKYESLRDPKLPHRIRPEEFPVTTPDTFEEFKHAQWQFCAPTLRYSMGDRFKAEDILPIIRREEIGRGGSGVIYKIVIHSHYNLLRPNNHESPLQYHDQHNTFVLKTYRQGEADECFETERRAFRTLRSASPRSAFPNIITYYGSFVHGSSHNIILEYADRKTLEDFMQHTERPSTFEDCFHFWTNIFGITHGLMTIHNSFDNDCSVSQKLHGWHQDLNPKNILVFSGKSKSPYDCRFKIGDLGLVHFKRSDSQAHDPSDFDAFGTRAYGAPETFRSHEEIDSAPLKITQSVDIWSLGCIFSEAAVWAQDGWKRVVEYRRQRSNEVSRKGGGEGEQIFHYGGSLLNVVRDIHHDILNKPDMANRTTQLALNLVDDMLQHKERYSARFLFEKSMRKSEELRKKYDVAEPAGFTNGESFDGNEARRMARPTSQSSRGHSFVPSSPSPSKRYSHRGERKLAPNQPLPPDGEDDDGDDDEHDDSYSSPHFSSSLRPPSRRHQHRSSSQSYENQNTNPLNLSQFDQTASQVKPDLSIPQINPRKTSDEHVVTAVDAQVKPETPIGSQQDSGSHYRQFSPEGFERPSLTIEAGHAWKTERKAHRPAPLPGRENIPLLDRRNHIFLVDNSETMKRHKTDMERVVSLLAYMLKGSDKDGLDIFFTQTLKKINSTKSKELSRSIYHQEYVGATDMRARLQTILQEHRENFGKQIRPPRTRFGRQPPSEPQRPLSFYVLTDAQWKPTDVGGLIKDMVQDMITKGCRKEHLGIQFIRFGEDEASISRLDKLDHGLGLKAIGMDIVDTTYWNGNVWKQLLGALSDWYDEDPTPHQST